MAAADSTGHRRVHGRRREERAPPGGRPCGGASTETPVAHLRQLHNPARAAQIRCGAEDCRAGVTHAPTVKRKKIKKEWPITGVALCVSQLFCLIRGQTGN